ncbi:hypothetical protein [Lentzea nigeriaca]|uniref:hypothetical protein n=1 Tax=Lentzea nigeriaca TaxID=1128665 RepID=UPI001958890D|nr:hypothetical protein [Lentzea nigeriaca]MBM7858322.1 hypothetical protein [Lentzea nigeriaca]
MKALLLLPEDELALQAAIVAEQPTVRLVDERAPWPAMTTSRPPARDSVLDIERSVLIWDPSIHPRLPRPRFTRPARRSPLAGRVVRLDRGTYVDGVLTASVISAVLWDGMKPEMVSLFSTVWRAVLQGTSGYLVRWVEGTGQEQRIFGMRIGHHALAAAREGRISLGDERMRLYPPSQEKARGAHW